MKKVFTLFAAVLLGICAYAQDAEPCPSKLGFTPVAVEQQANKFEIELTLLYNNSDNLNGFNMEVIKSGGQWCNYGNVILPSYFTADGYGHNILGNLAGQVSDAELDAALSSLCDVKNSIKEENLVIIEILSTLNCRFFPRVNEGSPIAIGKFAIDLSAEEDGEYTLTAPRLKPDGEHPNVSFSFTGGPEGSRAWTADEDMTITLVKTGDIVKVKGEEPQAVTVTGKVTDEENNPLEGATVTLTAGEETYNAITAADGTYTMEVVPVEGTTYTMTFAKDGYVTKTVEVESLDEVPEVVVLELVKVTVTGIVTDNKNVPLEGVAVTLNITATREAVTATTNAEGKYSMEVVPAEGATYSMTFAKDGYVTKTLDDVNINQPIETVVLEPVNTGISYLYNDNGDNRIYDLQGRELKSIPEQGVFIINGKKYVK